MSEPRPYIVGDHVSVTTTAYRRWWQLWKPKSWIDEQVFTCVYSDTTKQFVDNWSNRPERYRGINDAAR